MIYKPYGRAIGGMAMGQRAIYPPFRQPQQLAGQNILQPGVRREATTPSTAGGPIRAPAGTDPVSRQRLQQYINQGYQLGPDGMLYPPGYPLSQRPGPITYSNTI